MSIRSLKCKWSGLDGHLQTVIQNGLADNCVTLLFQWTIRFYPISEGLAYQ